MSAGAGDPFKSERRSEWQVANALEEGATAEDFIGALGALAPQVRGPRVVAAALEIMTSVGLTLEQEPGS